MSILGYRVSSHRIAALVDSVFAIVMTILVLDIKVPHEADALTTLSVDSFLTGQFQDILIFVITFIMVGYLWIIQHGQAHVIRLTDRKHIWLTIAFLIFVALLPFSEALVNKFPHARAAELYFAVHMLIIGVINYAIWAYVTKDRSLVVPELSDRQIAAEKKKILVLPAVSLVAIAVACICPVATSYVLLLAPLAMSAMERRWAIRLSTI
jgi:uncharacterized membrane protein